MSTSPPTPNGPLVQNWVLSIQRELAKNTVLELAYNGNHSTRLPIIGDYNQAIANPVTATCNQYATPAVTSGCLGIQARRPDQSFGALTWLDPAGNNNYNGLSVRLEHRFSKGLYFLNSFTWSKAEGDSEQALEYYSTNTAANPQNINNLHAEYGPTSFDVKLINVSSVVYDLPFGKGRQYFSSMNRVMDEIFGGWQLTGINTANTGTPVNVYYAPSSINDVTGLSAEYRGEAFPAAQRFRQRAKPEHGTEPADLLRRLHVHPRRDRTLRSAISAATRSARRIWRTGTWARSRTSASPKASGSSSAASSSTS